MDHPLKDQSPSPESLHAGPSLSGPKPRRATGINKPVIGMAGGIGSGKSLVAKQFQKLGCAIIDADALSHQVLEQAEVRDALVSWWGDKVLNAQGQIDRKAVGRCVFGASDELRKLETLVHPKVNTLRMSLRHQYDKQPDVKAIVEDCPLLFEVGLEKQCDVVVFVAADREVRLARVKANRGWTAEDLESREKKQLGLDIKANRADHVIDNSGNEEQTFDQVRRLFLNITAQNKQLSD